MRAEGKFKMIPRSLGQFKRDACLPRFTQTAIYGWTCCIFSAVSWVVKSEGESLGISLDKGTLLASRDLVSGTLG